MHETLVFKHFARLQPWWHAHCNPYRESNERRHDMQSGRRTNQSLQEEHER